MLINNILRDKMYVWLDLFVLSYVLLYPVSIKYSTIEQKKRPVLDITGFFFRIRTHYVIKFVCHLSTNAEKESRYIQYEQLLLLQ